MGSDESCFNVSLIVSDRHTEFSDGVRIYFSGITPDLLSEDCGFDPWVAGKCSSPEVNFLSWLLLQYLFVPNITAVTGNRPWSFCQKWQWQVATKHIYTHLIQQSQDGQSGTAWEPIRQTSLDTVHQGMVRHSSLSSLSHCGLIIGLNECNWCVQAYLHLKNESPPKKK